MKLMMVPVTVWISTDRVNVANLIMLLAHMDLDVLTILSGLKVGVVLQPGPKINIVMMKTTTLAVTGMVELVVTIINLELIIIAKLVNALKALLNSVDALLLSTNIVTTAFRP